MLNLAIIGAGPAALSAAIYAARAGLSVKVFEQKSYGGVLAEIPLIENYPGFVGAGSELAQNICAQAISAGAELSYGECTEVKRLADHFELTIDDAKIFARNVLVATGSRPRALGFKLDVPVSYCALCDGALAKDQPVAVVGGANSAVQEAIYLSNLAETVTIITHSQLKADKSLLAQLQNHPNITVREQTEPTPALLNQFRRCFVYIGKVPATDFLKAHNVLDESGYIICETDSHQTKVSGLFAAGDVRAGTTKQAITASADGAAAAIEIAQKLAR